MKKKLVLGILFFLPVMFLLMMLTSKHYYNPLDIVKRDVPEIQKFEVETDTSFIRLQDHITVFMVFDEDPLKHLTEVSNVNEKAYKWAKGYKKFQIVFVVPEAYKASEMVIREKIGQYIDLKYWKFVFGSEAYIRDYFDTLKEGVVDKSLALNTHFYIIDKDRNMRGRLKDDEGDGGILYGYDATNLAELQKKVVPDLRILFQEYRDKREGKFDSDQRRLKELGDEQ